MIIRILRIIIILKLAHFETKVDEFYDKETGENKLDILEQDIYVTPSNMIDGKFINLSGSVSNNEDYCASDYIMISKTHDIITNGLRSSYTNGNIISFYDSSKAFISGIINNTADNYTLDKNDIPSNAVYARFCTRATLKANVSISLLSIIDLNTNLATLKDEYYEYCKILVGLYDNKEIEEITDSVSSLDGQIYSDGTIGSSQYYYHTEPILLNRGESILVRGNFQNPPIFKTDSTGSSFTKPQGTRKTCTNSGAFLYVQYYWYCYTAVDDTEYVSVNYYDNKGNTHRIYKAFFGYLTNIADRLNDINNSISTINDNISDIQGLITLDSFTSGYYLSHAGVATSIKDTNYKTTLDYYSISKNYPIFIGNAYMANKLATICFYDSNRDFISEVISDTVQDITIETSSIPSNAIYVRFATYKISINPSQYALFNQSSISQMNNDIVSLRTIMRWTDYISLGKTIFTVGGYISKTGTVSTNADYAYTADYLDYTIRKDISLYDCLTGNSYMALIAFYDSDKNFISEIHSVTSSQNGDYTVPEEDVPENTRYFRVSSSKVAYNIHNPRIDYTVSLKDEVAIHDSKITSLDNRVTVLENTSSDIVVRFDSFRGSSNALTPSSTLTLLNNHIATNYELICKITGEIEQISFGMGYSSLSAYDYRSYMAKWIQLTQTQIKVYGYYNNGWVLENTYTHGMTLTGKTTVIVYNTLDNEGNQTNVLKMYNDKGDVYTQSLNSWGVGAAFFTNDNTSENLRVELSFIPRDITKNVWFFGDSYFSYWPEFVYECGFTHWLRNSQPGLSPVTGVSDFQNLLSLGYRPSFAVYCLGMNGSITETQTDGEWVINSYQKQYIDSFKALCTQYNITPVFTCIPTVPTRQKTGFRTYVKSLNVRYIDMFEAVGADEYGIWHGAPSLRAYTDSNENTIYVQIYGDGHVLAAGDYTFDLDGNKLSYDITSVGTNNIIVNGVTYTRNTSLDIAGLLKNDGVHPTTLGAKVIASRVMLDFPEISILE